MNYLSFSMRSLSFSLICTLGLFGCSHNTSPSTATADSNAGSGTLTIRANGEDFVRQGFTSKDGWQIEFDHVYVTLGEVKAYQLESSFNPLDPQHQTSLDTKVNVGTDQPITIDLAQGDGEAEPVTVAEFDAPAGRYNALSWQMVNTTSENTTNGQGYPLMMVGTATKAETTVAFSLKFSQELGFVCGDFVGDERKGFLSDGDRADVEATFHFDHLFGDAATPADDDLNLKALGFDPLANLAQDGQLTIDSVGLKAQLSDADHQTLLQLLPSLGHVGEGHCEETKLGG